MSRYTRSTVVLGAATALALATAGWLTVGAAFADDTPTPTDSPAPVETPAPAPDDTATPDASPPEVTFPPRPPSASNAVPGLPSQLLALGTMSGDSFSHPISLTGRFPYTIVDNTLSTIQSGEPRKLTGGWYLTRTQWIKWKAQSSGTVYLSVATPSSGDDVGVNVYTGSSLTHLHKIQSNDQEYIPIDGAGTVSGVVPNNAAILSWDVSAGHTYYIQVGSSAPNSLVTGTAYDDITVWVAGANYHPSNDNLNHAKELKVGTGGSVSSVGLLAGSTMESWEPYDNDETTTEPRVGSIWYKWIAPADGTVTFSDCQFLDSGPSIDVFGDNGASVGYNGSLRHIGFDTGGYSGCTLFFGGGTVTTTVDKGERYYIQAAETLSHTARDVTVNIDATFSTPWIEKLSRTSGSHSGGTTLVITGQSLNAGGGTPTVKFGSHSGTVLAFTATSITVKTPSHSNGKVSVIVTSGVYTSNAGSYTFK
ncbi:hypothetical protein BH09ACT6_BH09ACT6_14400 [soil metagenome]